ncbi:MAG: MMPL family transporter [Spirochaetota bacterium]
MIQFIASNHILLIVLGFFLAVYLVYRFVGIPRIATASTRHPIRAIVLSFLFVGVLGIGLKNLTIDADMNSLLPSTVPCDITTKKIDKIFGGVESVFLSIEPKQGTVWTPAILEKVKAISTDLKKARYIDSVISISEAKDVVNEDDTLITRPFMEHIPRTSAEMAALRSLVKGNSLLGKKLVSEDDTVTLIIATVRQRIPVMTNGKTVAVRIEDAEVSARDKNDPGRPTLENLKAKYEDSTVTISPSGYTYLRHDMFGKMVADMAFFIIIGILIMLVFLYICFRSKRGMLLPFTVVILSLIGLYGFIGWMKEVLYIPYVIIAPMFIAIAHNYGTQLIANYYEDVQHDTTADSKTVARSGIIKMATPIFLSVATVIFGFLAMFGHPLTSIAYLGFFSAFGILVSFILTIVLTPAILSLLKVPSHLLKQKHGTMTDRILGAVASFIIRFRIPVIAVSVLSLIGFAFLIPRIDAESNMVEFYKKGAGVRNTFEMLGKKFSGAATLNLLIESENPVALDSPDDGIIKGPQILQWMERLQATARSVKDPVTGKAYVGDSYSLADQVAYLNKVMQNDPSQDRVPSNGRLIAQYLLLLDSAGGGKDLSSLVDYKYNNAQIVLQMPEINTKKVQTVIDTIRDFAKKNPPPGAKISFGGTVMYGQELTPLLIEGQIHSIILSLVIIVICYMVIFRSFTAGFISSIPLIVAILSVFGLMSIFRIKLDFVTSILTSIMIGAGTDYTAYFLWRMREMTQKHGDVKKAYHATMLTIGKGIVFNGFSVVIGFVVLLFSNFQPVIFFGFLIAVSIFICIIAALTVMPAVIIMMKPKFLFVKGKDIHTAAHSHGGVIAETLPVEAKGE